MSAANVWDSSSFSLNRGVAVSGAATTRPGGSYVGSVNKVLATPVRLVQGGCDVTKFQREVLPAREPAVLHGIIIGQCMSLWSPEYLMEKGGDKEVSVHVSTADRMDFMSKNFVYRTLPFDELVKRCAYGCEGSGLQDTLLGHGHGQDAESSALGSGEGATRGHKVASTPSAPNISSGAMRAQTEAATSEGKSSKQVVADVHGEIVAASQDASLPFFMKQSEKYYLRALGKDPRKDVADFSSDFPDLAGDLHLPQLYDPCDYFSSVIRMDNALVQVVGTKRVVLFPPSDADALYIKGDKSQVLDIDNPDLSLYPLFKNAHPFECTLHPGDVLFIPALWFHNVMPHDFSVAVNVFWRQLPKEMYESNDTYGNKDPVPATRAMMSLSTALKALSTLPADHQDFFARRMVSKIKSAAYLAGSPSSVDQ